MLKSQKAVDLIGGVFPKKVSTFAKKKKTRIVRIMICKY